MRAFKPLGYEQISGAAAATALTVPEGTCRILIKCETQAIRWRDDGVDPTAAVGYPLAVGTELIYESGQATRLKVIEQAASTVVNVVYYGLM